MNRHLVLGTAGHIDHGKTALIRALTGVDTDRLPEEKKRGISIDLGFAPWESADHRISFVDVPGHERFVHNMVAGATGLDAALLVVAADDAVMPQTVEHLAILDLLGLTRGMIAVTKIDLVDPETMPLVLADIRDHVRDTFLESAPIVSVSSKTGEGLDAVREELTRLARETERRPTRGPFRLPIDRVFTREGRGTVVTGTAYSGTVSAGDELVLMPAGRGVRVRGLETHHHSLDSVAAGQRCAVNLAGIKRDEITRGDELITPGTLVPTLRFLAEIRLIAGVRRPKRSSRMKVRLHAGTREATATLRLPDTDGEAGQPFFAEMKTDQPMLLDHGQRFILRRLSPATTLGGGRVLLPHAPDRRPIANVSDWAKPFADPDPSVRLAHWLTYHDPPPTMETLTPQEIGIEPDDLEPILESLTASGIVSELPRSGPIHRDRLSRLGEWMTAEVRRQIRDLGAGSSIDRTALVEACRPKIPPDRADDVIDQLLASGVLAERQGKIRVSGSTAKLSKALSIKQQEIQLLIESSGLTPPPLKELQQSTGLRAADLQSVLQWSEEEGLLQSISKEFWYAPAMLAVAQRQAVERIGPTGSASVADLKDAWRVTRKHAVPLCEYLDRIGVTHREGDRRRLARDHSPQASEESR